MTSELAAPRLNRLWTLLFPAAAFLALTAPPLPGQLPAPPPPSAPSVPSSPQSLNPETVPKIEFDVALFKLNKTGTPPPLFAVPPNGDSFTIKNRPMRDLIRYAYAINSGATLHFANAPDWINTDRWDIEAKVAESDIPTWQKLTIQQKAIAMRGFLAESLKLQIRYDTQEYPCYALTLNNKTPNPKMKEVQLADIRKQTFVIKPGEPPPVLPGTWQWTGPNEITASAITMTTLVQFISGHADRTVIDKTGLTGYYSFVLKFDPSDPDTSSAQPNGAQRSLSSLHPEVATPIIFSAVKEQLGLRLVSAKAPLEGVVIDHIERPPED